MLLWTLNSLLHDKPPLEEYNATPKSKFEGCEDALLPPTMTQFRFEIHVIDL
jgi:hypothetical protein